MISDELLAYWQRLLQLQRWHEIHTVNAVFLDRCGILRDRIVITVNLPIPLEAEYRYVASVLAGCDHATRAHWCCGDPRLLQALPLDRRPW